MPNYPNQKSEEESSNLKDLVSENSEYFPNILSEFIYFRTYSRWIESKKRREVWSETVARYLEFMQESLGDKLNTSELARLERAITKFEVMPSMRLLFSAGKAARSNHIAAYNCAFLSIREINDFSEIMYLLMCGTGVGFSVENKHVENLPIIKCQQQNQIGEHRISDSREGWSDALRIGMNSWWEGSDIIFDYSLIRPAGSRLQTMGGRSAGPEPLRLTMSYIRNKILSRQGTSLSALDAQDIACKIAECIVAGGVRRSALLSLSDLSNTEIRDSKRGDFFANHPERSMVNLSVAYNEKPTCDEFLEEWLSLLTGNTGERGIFNRSGLKNQMPNRRWLRFAKDIDNSGTNPCGEIVLKSKQFCNLSEVVARKEDTLETLLNKIETASILGTYQASLVNFPFISKEWRDNCLEESLLGVSITGILDCPILQDPKNLQLLREKAISTNREYAQRFGIREAAAVTCVKPSGTVSLLVDSASGIHPRFAKYYIRRVRISSSDPLFKLLKEQGYPYLPELGQNTEDATTYVLEFPVKSPEGTTTVSSFSALEQLEHWKKIKLHFTEHNPSITVLIRKNEWIMVLNWLYENWKYLGGLTFFPFEQSSYQMAPYEEISEAKFKEMKHSLPKIDFSQLFELEGEDHTGVISTLECSGSVCDR